MNNQIDITDKKVNPLVDEGRIGMDIFSGAGGLSLGAEMAGITVRYAIEINKSAAYTYKKNHPETSVLCEDITKLDPKKIVGEKELFIIMGGPPCQGFQCLTL